MSSQANYFKLGLFIIVATVLAVGGVVVLGAGALFRDTMTLESYFDESVQGLDVGSAVKYRGITIGKVDTIDAVATNYDVDDPMVLVRYSIYSDMFQGKYDVELEDRLHEEINKGLRIRLVSMGLTGTLYMEVDYLDKDRFPVKKISWKPKYPRIPTAPNMITRLSEALDNIMRNLERINIYQMTVGLEQTLNNLNQVLQGADLAWLSTEIQRFVSEMRETNAELLTILRGEDTRKLLAEATETVGGVKRMVDDLEKPIAELEKTIASVNGLVNVNRTEVQEIVYNLRLASEDLRELMNNSKKYPPQLLFGKPPER